VKEVTVVAAVMGATTATAVVMESLDAMPDSKAATVETAAMAGSSDAGGLRPGAVQVDATLDLKASAKTLAATTGLGGSSPPRKCFHGGWRYAVYFF
jgi:hypothetical protein